jgi:hypothetical protein
MAKKQPQRIDRTPIWVAIITTIGLVLVAYWQFVWKPSTSTPAPTPQQIHYTGRVIDGNSGSPIRGAKVALDFQDAPPIVYTDSEGVYGFTITFIGDSLTGRVRVEVAGYQNYDRFTELSSKNTGIEDIRLISIPLTNNNQDQIARYDLEITNRFRDLKDELAQAEAGHGNIYRAYSKVTRNAFYSSTFPEFKEKTVATLLFELTELVPPEQKAAIMEARRAVIDLEDLDRKFNAKFQAANTSPDGVQGVGDKTTLKQIENEALVELQKFLQLHEVTFSRWLPAQK